MPSLDAALIVLAGIAFFAAFVNGALGYGFSSLTVPLALIFYTNRILNPAVVVIEVILNWYVLFINLSGVPSVWKRVFPILVGMLPGIATGAFVLASLQPGWIKLVPSVIDFTDNLRIDGSAMTEMHRDRETDCREEVRGEAQRGGAGTA
jgi:uncharacterized membrane protein YfcA